MSTSGCTDMPTSKHIVESILAKWRCEEHLAVAVQVALPDRLPREQENVPVPDILYPLLHVGVHVLPLARLDVQVPSAPFAGAVTAHGLALHVALPDTLPREQENVPVPDIVYPLLHVGVHELPLARLAVQSPSAPFVVAAVASHALAWHTAVSVVSVPAVHVCTFRTSSCWRCDGHVGGEFEGAGRAGDSGKGENVGGGGG